MYVYIYIKIVIQYIYRISYTYVRQRAISWIYNTWHDQNRPTWRRISMQKQTTNKTQPPCRCPYQYIPAIFERSSSKDCRAKYILVLSLLKKNQTQNKTRKIERNRSMKPNSHTCWLTSCSTCQHTEHLEITTFHSASPLPTKPSPLAVCTRKPR